MPEYLLPDVGEGLTEAEIVTWKVKVGDTIEINDIVCEIETAKSMVELPAPVRRHRVGDPGARGRDHPVGTPIIAIGDDGRGRGGRAGAPGARREMEIDLSNPAASGSGEGEQPGRPDEGRPRPDPARRARSPPAPLADAHAGPGVLRDRAGLAAGRGRRARARRAGPLPAAGRAAGARPRCACWPSRRSASSPRTSASTSAALDATGPNGTITRERRRDRAAPASTSRRPRAGRAIPGSRRRPASGRPASRSRACAR